MVVDCLLDMAYNLHLEYSAVPANVPFCVHVPTVAKLPTLGDCAPAKRSAMSAGAPQSLVKALNRPCPFLTLCCKLRRLYKTIYKSPHRAARP